VRALLSFCLAFHHSSTLPCPSPASVWLCCTFNLPSFSLHAFLATLHFVCSQLSFPYSHPLSLSPLPYSRPLAHIRPRPHSAHPVPSTRFILLSFFVPNHRPVTSACFGRWRISESSRSQHSRSHRRRCTGMRRTFHFPVLESHCGSIVAFGRPQHAPCGFPLDHHMLCPCNV
jgi:hypothetical protein